MDDARPLFDIAELQGAWHQPGHHGGVRIALVYLNSLGALRGSGFDFSDQEMAARWFAESFPSFELDELHSQWVNYEQDLENLPVIL